MPFALPDYTHTQENRGRKKKEVGKEEGKDLPTRQKSKNVLLQFRYSSVDQYKKFFGFWLFSFCIVEGENSPQEVLHPHPLGKCLFCYYIQTLCFQEKSEHKFS